jgi:DNA modification methylase
MKISQLKLNPNNPQKFDDLSALKRSIQEFPKMMELRPMVYDPKTMYVLGGNKRLISLNELGYKEIPDNWVLSGQGLSEEEKKRFILADNIGFGEWDLEILDLEFSEFNLDDLGLDLSKIEFETSEIYEQSKKKYESKKEHQMKGVLEDDLDNEIVKPDTDIQYGDLFKIGNHFLLCGDATKSDDCLKLMQGNKSDMIFTDPPYDLEDSYSQNIFDSAKEDSHVFIMNSDKKLIEIVNNGINLFHGFFAVDFRQAHLISNNSPMTRIDLIAEFRTGKGKFNNLHDGFTTLIECSKIHNDNEKINFGHKQAKKIELPSTFIQHYSNENEIVCDFFGGSGSTMAACEQLNRICYMIEFDNQNCQIIINRMKKCYGLKAIKLT